VNSEENNRIVAIQNIKKSKIKFNGILYKTNLGLIINTMIAIIRAFG
jgi:hypothetical protein